jgi:hypothetical protein
MWPWKLDNNTFDHLVLISLIWGPMNMTLIHTPVNKFTSFCDIMYSWMNQSILVKHMSIPWVWMAQNLVEAHFLVGSMFQCLSYTWAFLMFMESMFFICADMLVWWRRGRKEATAHCFSAWISFTPFVIYIGQCHVFSHTPIQGHSACRTVWCSIKAVLLHGVVVREEQVTWTSKTTLIMHCM